MNSLHSENKQLKQTNESLNEKIEEKETLQVESEIIIENAFAQIKLLNDQNKQMELEIEKLKNLSKKNADTVSKKENVDTCNF